MARLGPKATIGPLFFSLSDRTPAQDLERMRSPTLITAECDTSSRRENDRRKRNVILRVHDPARRFYRCYPHLCAVRGPLELSVHLFPGLGDRAMGPARFRSLEFGVGRIPREGQSFNLTWYIKEKARLSYVQRSDASCVPAKKNALKPVAPLHLAAAAAAGLTTGKTRGREGKAWRTALAPLSLRHSAWSLACVPMLYDSKLFSYTSILSQ